MRLFVDEFWKTTCPAGLELFWNWQNKVKRKLRQPQELVQPFKWFVVPWTLVWLLTWLTLSGPKNQFPSQLSSGPNHMGCHIAATSGTTLELNVKKTIGLLTNTVCKSKLTSQAWREEMNDPDKLSECHGDCSRTSGTLTGISYVHVEGYHFLLHSLGSQRVYPYRKKTLRNQIALASNRWPPT